MSCRVCETRHWTGDPKKDGGEKQCCAAVKTGSYTGTRCCLPALPDTSTSNGTIITSFHCKIHSGRCRFLYDTYKLTEKKISDALANSTSTSTSKVDGAQLLYFILFDESKDHNDKLLEKLQQLDFKAVNSLSVLIEKVVQFRRSHTTECFSKECMDKIHPELIAKYETFLVFLNNYLDELKRRRITSNILGSVLGVRSSSPPTVSGLTGSSATSVIGLPVYGIMGGRRTSTGPTTTSSSSSTSPPRLSTLSSSSSSKSRKKSKRKKTSRASSNSTSGSEDGDNEEKLDDILKEFEEIDRINAKFKPISTNTSGTTEAKRESKVERKTPPTSSTSVPTLIFVNPRTGSIESSISGRSISGSNISGGTGSSVPFDVGKVSDLSGLWSYAEQNFRGPGFIQLNPQFLMPVFPLDKMQLESRATTGSSSSSGTGGRDTNVVVADEAMSDKLKDATIKLITYPGRDFSKIFSALRSPETTPQIYSAKTLGFAKTIIDELSVIGRIFEMKFKVPIQSMIPIVWSAYSVKRQVLFDVLPSFIAKQVQDEIESIIKSRS